MIRTALNTRLRLELTYREHQGLERTTSEHNEQSESWTEPAQDKKDSPAARNFQH